MNLIEQNRLLHDLGYFRGLSILPYVEEIGALVRETGSKTLLDYGCGKGEQYIVRTVHWAWDDIAPALYDPAVPAFATKPKRTFDGVICTDVAEHIDEPDIDGFLSELVGFARRFVFLSICCREGSKILPDGRNCHLTVRPEDWWLRRVKAHGPAGLLIVTRFTD